MKRAQMRSDKKNISAVVVETFGALTTYTIFYNSGTKRRFNSPSVEFRSRFDFWFERFDSDDIPLIWFSSNRVVVLTLSQFSVIPDSVYSYIPYLRTLVESEGFVL